MKKKVIAFVVAFAITGIVAVSMLVVGVNAATNKNGVAVSNSPAQSALQSSVSSSLDPQAQIAQLQDLVNQYQAREQQYQTQLQDAQTQVGQAQQDMQMVQQLMNFLQQRGIISIDTQGNITVNGGFERRGDGFGG